MKRFLKRMKIECIFIIWVIFVLVSCQEKREEKSSQETTVEDGDLKNLESALIYEDLLPIGEEKSKVLEIVKQKFSNEIHSTDYGYLSIEEVYINKEDKIWLTLIFEKQENLNVYTISQKATKEKYRNREATIIENLHFGMTSSEVNAFHNIEKWFDLASSTGVNVMPKDEFFKLSSESKRIENYAYTGKFNCHMISIETTPTKLSETVYRWYELSFDQNGFLYEVKIGFSLMSKENKMQIEAQNREP